MALDLVTGYKGQNHVTAEQWADFNRGIYGDAAILPIGNKMQVEIQTANQITVKDGTGVFDGRQVYIGYGESENIAIESGTQQMLRHDIVVIKYTKDETSGVENVAFEVIIGTPVASDPADPTYQDMDIRTGVFTSQKPFCRVRLNGVAIEGVDMLVEVKEFAGHAFEPLAANLTTSEPGQALDATMGKQLKESMDELEDDVSELNQNMTRTSNAVTSGYPVTNYDTYKENGIQHIKAVISATVSPSAAEDSYFTIGFVPEIPLQTEMFAGIYLHNSHIYPVILRISANKNIGIYTSDEITALGSSSGSVFIETSYSI